MGFFREDVEQDVTPRNLTYDPIEAIGLFRKAIDGHCVWAISSEDKPDVILNSLLLMGGREGLIFDWPPGIQKAHDLKNVIAKTKINHIPLEIHLSSITDGVLNGNPVLQSPWPNVVYHWQRRQYFRAIPPRSDKVACVIWLSSLAPGASEDQKDEHGEWVNATVRDLSGGGLSLEVKDASSPAWQENRVLKDVKCILPGNKTVNVNLKIERNFIDQATQRAIVGCSFYNTTNSSLRHIENYVIQIQRTGIVGR